MKALSDYRSVYDAFQDSAREFAGRAFLHVPAIATRDYAPGDLTYTYAGAAKRVCSLASAYSSKGLKEGERVLFRSSDNRKN